MFVTYKQTSTIKRWRQEIHELRSDCTVGALRVTLWLALAGALMLGSGAFAHDIPNDVTVHAFVTPDGERLLLLVRAPLRPCCDVDVPKRRPGYPALAG